MTKWVISLALLCTMLGCTKINVYEKQINLPKFTWKKDNKLNFVFENNDIASKKYIYAIIRHTNNYPYTNMWVQLTATDKAGQAKSDRYNIPLTQNNSEWLGVSVDDITEVRVKISTIIGDVGQYTFTLEHIMRDASLPELLSIGLRIENE